MSAAIVKTEDLERFCAGPNDSRYYLQAPWRDGAVIYATNGHVIVEIANDGRNVDEATSLHPKPAALFKKLTAGPQWLDLPELPPAGVLPSLCMVCRGSGWTCEPFEEKARRCACCDGLGESGLLPWSHTTTIGGVHFQTRYVRLLEILPDVRIAPALGAGALFTFDGGRGVLMPLNPPTATGSQA